jgi:chromatin remodeling complex protein RSC6
MVSKAKKSTRKPRASKAKKTTTAPTPSLAPTAAPPAPTKAPVKTVSKATPAKASAKATPAKDESTLADAFVHVLGQLTSLRSQLTHITGQVRVLAKRADRELRAAQKASRKRSSKSGTRAPSGFVKPTRISKELAAFLGKDWGTEMARTQVTREINAYIRAHNLQDPKNGRRILADTKLRKLLKLQKSDELTYFNLQRYMSPHFAKASATKALAAAAAVAAAVAEAVAKSS